jgi:hypothetical protein
MLKKFLLGQYSLLISFWVIYALGTIILSIFVFSVSSIFLLFLLLLFICLSLVGVWNSCKFYIEEKKKLKKSILFGIIARIWVLIILVFMIQGLILNYDKLKMKGLGNFESLILGVTKGATQDLLNFFYYVPVVIKTLIN